MGAPWLGSLPLMRVSDPWPRPLHAQAAPPPRCHLSAHIRVGVGTGLRYPSGIKDQFWGHTLAPTCFTQGQEEGGATLKADFWAEPGEAHLGP